MELKSYIISEKTSICDAAAAIDRGGRQIVFVCDGLKLLASLSDGDIRRYIMRGGDISKSVSNTANYKPFSLPADRQNEAQTYMRRQNLRAIPILSADGDIIAIIFSDSVNVRQETRIDVPAVIMAGGKGTRLSPYTDVLPKPLIPVAGKTITEHIMDKFSEFGCHEITMIVNYKKELIKAYFSGTSARRTPRFVDEYEYFGTGGGLKLLEGSMNDVFFMTNCDVLIEADYGDILARHKKSGALITMVCAMKKVSVPYGTVEIDGNGRPVRLVEKPEYPLLTNTGFYVIQPEFIREIPKDTFVHITDLIQSAIDSGKPVCIYPISDAGWMDMGNIDELHKMEQRLQ